MRNSRNFFRFSEALLTFAFYFGTFQVVCPCVSMGPMEGDDPLSFVEPSVIGQDLFRNEFIFYSEPYGMDKDSPSQGLSSQYYYDSVSRFEIEKANIREWESYLNEKRGISATRNEIVKFFYGNISYEMQDWLKKGPEEKSFSKTARANAKEPFGAQTDLKDYSDFLRQLDPIISSMTAGEQYDPATRKWGSYSGDMKKDLEPFFKIAEERAKDPRLDEFLEVKYGYHLVRMAATAKLYPESLHYYDLYVGNHPSESLTRFRALGYKAKALVQTQERSKALQTYLDIIDQCPSLRLRELQSIRETFKREELLSYAASVKNRHKLTTLYYVLGIQDMHDHSPQALRNIFEVGPQEAQAEATLLRCVLNIEKENFLFDRFALIGFDRRDLEKKYRAVFSAPTPDPMFNDEWNLSRSRAFELTLKKGKYDSWIALCEKYSVAAKTRQPALWSIMASYLALLEGDASKADRLYQEALSKKTKNAQLEKQIHLIGTLIGLQKPLKTISAPLQKRLLEDLNWASTLRKEGSNSGIYHSLLVLLGQKYLFLKDIPRATLSFGAVQGPRWGPYYGSTLYLLDAVMSDPELDVLREILRSSAPSVLEKYLKKSSGLLADDIQLLRAVKRAREDDYASALGMLEKVSTSYLKFKKRTKDAGGNWLPEGFYEGSTWVNNKTFLFQRECAFINSKAKVEQMDIISYFKMVKGLKERIRSAKEQKDKSWCSMNYELAGILGTQMLTGWPEVRRSVNSDPDTYVEEYSNEYCRQYPFKIPGATEFMENRYKEFLVKLQNYNKKALRVCDEIIRADVDPEVTAKSLAYASVMEAPWIRSYDPSSPKAQAKLVLLRDRYSDTEFYKNYATWCEPLKKLGTKKTE